VRGLTRRALLGGALTGAAFPAIVAAGSRRIAATELILTETLLALGIVPVAVGNRPLYRRLVGEPLLPASANDLGPLNEPNLELLQYLRPDLILAAEWQQATQVHLERMAPVAWLPTFSLVGKPLDNARSLARRIGELTGTASKAQALVSALDARLVSLAGEAGASGRPPVYVVRFMEDGRHLLVFGKGSLVDDVLQLLDLENAWADSTNVWGASYAGIESLTRRPDAIVLYFATEGEGSIAHPQGPLWQVLINRVGDRMVPIPPVFPAGGVASALRLGEAIVGVLRSRMAAP
jgi:iron complex transport system substrate-binding protein